MGHPPSDPAWVCIESILEKVAAHHDTDTVDLPPLYDVVDPDALASLLESGDDSLRIEFSYHGCRVVVQNGGDVSIQTQEQVQTERSAAERLP